MAENGAIFWMRNTNLTIRVIEFQFSLIDGHYVKVSNMEVSHSTFLLRYYRFNYLGANCPFSLVSIRVPICHISFLVLLLAQLKLPQPNDTKQTFLFTVTQTNACLCTCLCVTYLYCIELWTYFFLLQHVSATPTQRSIFRTNFQLLNVNTNVPFIGNHR